MYGFVVLSASAFIYFTYQIIDDGLCDATQSPGLQRDPNKQLRYAQFIEHFYHVLDVPKIEGVAVQTGRHCLLRCVKNDRCFSTNIGVFHPPTGNVSCDLLPTDKYNASEKFKANHTFHHYSIMVSLTNVYYNCLFLLNRHACFALKLWCLSFFFFISCCHTLIIFTTHIRTLITILKQLLTLLKVLHLLTLHCNTCLMPAYLHIRH